MEAIRSVLLLGLISPFLLLINTIEAATFTFSNNCQYNVWPATLTGGGPQLSTTGFELASGESNSVDVPRPWSGRVWGRSLCSTEASGRFFCQTADCSSGKVECDGAGGVPPASLAELTLADSTDEHDTYDISLVDGFNLPISLTPQGGAGDCSTTSCPANINSVCPPELSVNGTDGGVIECKSACAAFNKPEYCCTEQYGESGTCYATNYSKIFKDQCPQAYSFAYNDNSSTFTCAGGPNYLVTFCP